MQYKCTTIRSIRIDACMRSMELRMHETPLVYSGSAGLRVTRTEPEKGTQFRANI